MKIVGVNFSDSSIEAVEVTQGLLQAPTFSGFSRVVIEDGCIENGIILKPDVVVTQLQKLLSQAKPRPITKPTIALSLPEGQIFSRLLSFPKDTSAAEVDQTITVQLSRFIPFEPSEVLFDNLHLGVRGDKQDMLVVAVQRTVVQGYEAIAQQMGWTVKAIELESISSARAVLDSVPADQAVMLLDVGARTTIASWFDQFGLRYSYNIPLAGNYFTEQVIKQLHCTALEAEQRKQAEGFTGKMATLLTEAWAPIFKQLREGLAYVQTNYALPTRQIHLLGGSARLPGLADFITQQLHVETILASLLPKLKKNDMVQQIQQEGAIYYNAIGLVLGECKGYHQRPAINFYRKH